ncbi:N-acetylmuramoyl-L-alanine amidase [Tumebacillus sp. ITR2]|uniref:N-acetylmuramoyl-L-alanine amidase n=1 Tax=Tumebacillus amylolyticus TaxID=2801339 RepID=A0ABS1J7N1_9BACL|nr:N-acetylmuramoyl-L-alanine amidase [Tumebacillus amylolyticus]MBL0386283.1 N-acetylmuramoyl-L-alanine amidase [Tumebacillus amylolyticus]
MPTIVIDPGHGGIDPGTVGNGYQEKMLVLQTSLLLRDALRRCGFQVIMTRESDTLPLAGGSIGDDLAYRAQLANNNNADLFVSWHVDAASSSDVNGVAVWIHPSTRGTRTDQWAQAIVNGIANSTGQKNRGVYLGDFQVIRDTKMDAVLVESGFITNAVEASNLADTSFQMKEAEGAARAICGIFNIPYNQPVPTPQPSTPTPTPTPTPAPTPTPTPTNQEVWPQWAATAIQNMIDWGIMVGFPDGTWKPDQQVTRAELAVALEKFYEFIRRGGATG